MSGKRFLPLLLAFVIGTAPLAVELCEAACMGVAPIAEHSCHHHADTAQPVHGLTIEALPHLCGHDYSIPESSLTSVPVIPPAALTLILPADLLVARQTDHRTWSGSHVPIPPLLIQAPLRL